MKNLLALLMAAMLLPLTSGAVDLGPNQLLMGHYLTDDLATSGWGSNALEGVATVATDITPDELALYSGGKIVAFRVGLFLSTPVSRVFVIPVTPDEDLVMNDMVEWTCDVSNAGWNMIPLETPYELDNLPSGYSLRIGFDYVQETKFKKPLSVVKIGTTYPTLHYVDGEWKKLVLGTKGNLSLQCVVEGENFPEYVIRVRNITLDKMVKTGTPANYSFETYNLGIGNVPAGGCTYEIAVDGEVVATMTNPTALTSQPITLSGQIATDNIPAGGHTLSITPASINGEPMDNPPVFTVQFKTYDFGFPRQMHVLEQFTSTGCTWCPTGTNNIVNLMSMRDDVAWVALHVLFGSPTDPYALDECASIRDYEGVDGYPEGTFDRTPGISSQTQVYGVLTTLTGATMNAFFNYLDEQSPSWATVNVNSTFDSATRKAKITINGELVPGFDAIMGEDSRLTVYLTEDGLVAPQMDQGNIVNNYVHNNVLRKVLGSVKGVAINKDGDTYKNEFEINIPNGWNADKMNIVAFINRPLGNNLSDIYITNANKRKLGEYDEPQGITGDVDGDGLINIADVTTLIGCLLTGTQPENAANADCDGDGLINIADVTTLIGILLTTH